MKLNFRCFARHGHPMRGLDTGKIENSLGFENISTLSFQGHYGWGFGATLRAERKICIFQHFSEDQLLQC